MKSTPDQGTPEPPPCSLSTIPYSKGVETGWGQLDFGLNLSPNMHWWHQQVRRHNRRGFAKWNSWWHVPTAHMDTSGGHNFYLELGPLDPSVRFLLHGSSVMGTSARQVEPIRRFAMKVLPWAKLNRWWGQPQLSFSFLVIKTNFSTSFHAGLGLLFRHCNYN